MSVVLWVLMAVCIYFGLIRNTQVYRFRMRLLYLTTLESAQDYLTLYHPAWREVEYDQLLLQFWKPMASHYEGTALATLASLATSKSVPLYK